MRVYVGTYGKYNSGSIEGKWLDIEDYSDKDAFYEACQELHGEGDHEFMFQDHEGIPDKYISESSISDDLWDEWVDLQDWEKEACEAYWDYQGGDDDPSYILEQFRGKFSSKEDYVREYLDDQGSLRDIGWLANHIDFESIVNEWETDGTAFIDHDGEIYVFVP